MHSTNRSNILFILFFLGFIKVSIGQIAFKVHGRVVNNLDSSINANVLLIKSQDSSLITGNFFLDGIFEFTQLKTQDVLLKITSLGYKDTIVKSKQIINDRIDFGIIQLNLINNLKEVVVSSTIPIFERSQEGTIINVENTMLSSTTSLIELLTKTPSVRVEDNLVSIFGKGEALIYLNGKQITFDRLGSIPVNRVIKIEIISNPSAKYDAKGRAVINIITKKNTQEGLNGQITENITQAQHFLSSHAINLNYKIKKISLFCDYSLSLGTDWKMGNVNKVIYSSGETFKSQNNFEENTRLTNVSNYRLGFNYDINKHSDFSIQYDGLYNKYNLNVSSITNMVGESTGNTTYLDVFNNGQTINSNNSFNVNYNNNLDTLGSSIFIGGQYCNFNTMLYDQIDEKIRINNSLNSEANRVNDGLDAIQLITSQLDFIKNFRNNSKLETGAKYSYVSNNGQIRFKSKEEGSNAWVDYPQFDNNFNYIENVPAMYLQYAKSFNTKWITSIGARTELSNIYGFSRVLNKKVIDTTYLNFFPTAKIVYNRSKNLSYNLSFSSRINRPTYQNIDPFVWYLDSLTSIQGNPHLVPEKSYTPEFQIVYKAYSLKFGYAYTTDPMKRLPIIGENGPNSIINTMFNLKSSQQFYLTFDIPFESKYFNSYNTINGAFESVKAFTENITTQMATLQLYFYSYNQFKIKNYFKLDFTIDYTSAYSDGLYKYKPKYSFGCGASKSFFKKKLFLRVMANDFLRTYYEARNSQIGIIQSESYKKLNTFFIRLTIAYKFGRLKQPTYKNISINDNEYNRTK